MKRFSKLEQMLDDASGLQHCGAAWHKLVESGTFSDLPERVKDAQAYRASAYHSARLLYESALRLARVGGGEP